MISYCYRNNEHQDQYNGNTHGYSCPDPPFKTSLFNGQYLRLTYISPWTYIDTVQCYAKMQMISG